MKDKQKKTLIVLYYLVILVVIGITAYLSKHYYENLMMARWPYVFMLGSIRAISLIILGFLLPYRKIINLAKVSFKVRINFRRVFLSCLFPALIICFIWIPLFLGLFFGINSILQIYSIKLLSEYPIVLQMCWIIIGFNIIYNIDSGLEK